jgi:hypothetical protein
MFRKKLSLVLIIICAIAFAASGFGRAVGIKAGFGLGGFSGKDASGLNPNYSFSGDVFYTQHVAPFFAVQPEFLFIRKGCSLRGTPGGTFLTYFEIPVLLKGTLPTTGSFKPFIYAGPSLGILLSAKAEVSGFIKETWDVKDEMNTIDLGILLGIGTDINAGPGAIVLDFRYEPSFLNNAKKENGIQPEIKNYCFGLSAGYAMKF